MIFTLFATGPVMSILIIFQFSILGQTWLSFLRFMDLRA